MMEECIGCHNRVKKGRDFCSKSCEDRYTRIMEYSPDGIMEYSPDEEEE